MHMLIVGGAGYIGSHMVLLARDAGWKVTVFDNLSRGHADAVADAELFVGDLCEPRDLETCLSGHRFDLVMHFAALSDVGESCSQPDRYYRNNVVGTLNLLDAMRRHGLDRLVFSSTCASYGEPRQLPIPESHAQQPINPYGRSKLMIELALADYSRAFGLKSISLRYFNAAGCDALGRAGERHDPETHLIPLVLREALRLYRGGDPAQTRLRVNGLDFPTRDGSCIRDYIHVQDLCRAHLLAGERLLEGRCAGAEFFNLANGQGFSVLEVIETSRLVTGQAISHECGPRRPGDAAELVGDARRARDMLGWQPEWTSLSDIVASAWDWMLAVDVD